MTQLQAIKEKWKGVPKDFVENGRKKVESLIRKHPQCLILRKPPAALFSTPTKRGAPCPLQPLRVRSAIGRAPKPKGVAHYRED